MKKSGEIPQRGYGVMSLTENLRTVHVWLLFTKQWANNYVALLLPIYPVMFRWKFEVNSPNHMWEMWSLKMHMLGDNYASHKVGWTQVKLREQTAEGSMLVREGGTRCAVLPRDPHHRNRAAGPNLLCWLCAYLDYRHYCVVYVTLEEIVGKGFCILWWDCCLLPPTTTTRALPPGFSHVRNHHHWERSSLLSVMVGILLFEQRLSIEILFCSSSVCCILHTTCINLTQPDFLALKTSSVCLSVVCSAFSVEVQVNLFFLEALFTLIGIIIMVSCLKIVIHEYRSPIIHTSCTVLDTLSNCFMHFRLP